eukprot:1667340-Pyramimonas_sp.AAC.1
MPELLLPVASTLPLAPLRARLFSPAFLFCPFHLRPPLGPTHAAIMSWLLHSADATPHISAAPEASRTRGCPHPLDK